LSSIAFRWRLRLGFGRAAGRAFLTGQASIPSAENEWSRILLESGPILGLAFPLIWRTANRREARLFAIRQVRLGNTLPLFLFSRRSLL
jgi:hypothetical protein